MSSLATIDESKALKLALNNVDVLQEIFRHLDITPTTNLDTIHTIHHAREKSLTNVALTCKAFKDPALDVLWGTLYSLAPLLKLLPSFQLGSDGIYTLRGTVNEEHWSRLEIYARRVRVFIYNSQEVMPITPSTYIRIVQICPSPLLPRLLRLQCDSIDTSGLGLFLFLTPSLRSIDIKGINTHHGTILEEFLATLSSGMPLLSSICLHGHLSDNMLSSVASIRTLRSLHLISTSAIATAGRLPCNSHETFQKIASLEYLSDFTAHLPEGTLSFALVNLPSTFQALKSLDIRESPGTVAGMLRNINWHLISLRIVLFQPTQRTRRTQRKTEYFSLILSAIQRTPSLRHICIEGKVDHDQIIKDLSPILQLKKLRSLRLENFSRYYSISSSEILEIVQSFPEIQVLHLPPAEHGLPIAELKIFVEQCPQLESLQVPLGISDPPHPFNISYSNHGLTTLYIVGIHIGSPILVARYLDDLFPHLKCVRGHPDFNVEGWDGVDSLVELCQDVRSDERKRNKALEYKE